MFANPSRSRLSTGAAGVLTLWLLAVGQVQAGSIVLDISSITGSEDRTGHPTSIAVDSLQFTKNGFVDHRHVDADTAALKLAFGALEKLGNVTIAIYKFAAPDKNPAVVTLNYPDTILSGLSIKPMGSFDEETDTFTSPKPAKMAFVVHGGAGSSLDLGFTTADLSGSTLTLARSVDAGTFPLQADLTAGAPLSADLLLYSDDTSTTPSDIITFSGVTVASQVYDPLGGIGAPETDVFTFTDLSQPVPEPASAVLLLGAIGSFAAFRMGTGVVARLRG